MVVFFREPYLAIVNARVENGLLNFELVNYHELNFPVFKLPRIAKGFDMRMTLNVSAALVIALLFVSNVSAQDKAAQEHEKMRGEHNAAVTDHQAWSSKISKMRVEHRRALAALAKLRAEILQHDADLEVIADHIRSHEVEMTNHDHAMEAHEAHGEGKKHDHLMSTHAEVMKRHASIGKLLEAEETHHKDLIDGILNFAKAHAKSFHSHEAGSHSHEAGSHSHEAGSHSHGDHDHDHDDKKKK